MPEPSPFHARTQALCASYLWKDWAGFLAVRSYQPHHHAEYQALRHAAGLLDIAPLFKYEISGRDAGAYLSYVTTRDIQWLGVGRVAYVALCDERGKLVDDGTVARLDKDRYRLTTAGPARWWLGRYERGFRVDVTDTSSNTAALAVQGPESREILAGLCGAEVRNLRYFRVVRTRMGKVSLDISRTGYTGDLGYELWMEKGDALSVWDAVMEEGKTRRLLPAGLDALDVTRVEAGFILQGVDYFSAPHCLIPSRTSSPYEAGLDGVVELERADGRPFVGSAALREEHHHGAASRLVGLVLDWEELESLYDAWELPPELPATAWRTPIPVYSGGHQVGQATSGTWSPLLKQGLALATVASRYAGPGTRLSIEHTVEYRRSTVTATVVPRPFYDPPHRRA